MTARLRDWQSRLQACLAERCFRPFAWGQQDCVLLGADCVDACTGVDPAASIRGTYSTAAEALQLLTELGGLAAIAAAHLGPEVNPVEAQLGDIGIVVSDGRECMAVCTGATWHAPGAAGLVALSFDRAIRAWRLVRTED